MSEITPERLDALRARNQEHAEGVLRGELPPGGQVIKTPEQARAVADWMLTEPYGGGPRLGVRRERGRMEGSADAQKHSRQHGGVGGLARRLVTDSSGGAGDTIYFFTEPICRAFLATAERGGSGSVDDFVRLMRLPALVVFERPLRLLSVWPEGEAAAAGLIACQFRVGAGRQIVPSPLFVDPLDEPYYEQYGDLSAAVQDRHVHLAVIMCLLAHEPVAMLRAEAAPGREGVPAWRGGPAPAYYTVTLRPEAPQDARERGESVPREWSCRWPVRGHERRLRDGRRVWVRAHMKGPADKPLVARRFLVKR